LLLLLGNVSIAQEPIVGAEILAEPTRIRILVGAEYTTTKQLTLAWDCIAEAMYYEVKALWIDPSTPVEYFVGRTSECQALISKPRTGHFKYRVRSHKSANLYSVWADSTDKTDAIVNGQPMGWWIFWKPGLPSQIIIQDTEE